MAEAVRALARYSGWVQGVGFRFTTRNVARRFAVSGYVRNLPNGKVEVVAEGDRGEVLAFLGAVRAAMEGEISHVDVAWGGASGEFDGFFIRF